MPNRAKITVEDPDEILNAGAYGAGAIIRLQTSATETGSYADVSGTGSTPTIPVVTLVRTYTGYDPNGIVSSWYHIRYENVGATRLSDWSAAFQTGDETAGQLCSIYDVQQAIFGTATPSSSQTELLIEYIAQASRAIEVYCGRWFAPRPLSGTATYLFSPDSWDPDLPIPVGIRSISSIGYALIDQPDTGGSYVTLAATDYSLQPSVAQRGVGWPATCIRLLWNGTLRWWYPGVNGVTITGAFGFASVPPDIQGVAQRMVVAASGNKETGAPVGLPHEATTDRAILDGYRNWAGVVQ